ncbi:hypothetical protein [Paenibacillus harenae]|uniref:Uncharacterized protein n=1 Tax=Paenibacillus harenae TaxID=306543 RepID=A0ABT9U3I5_PAEHA|nr:hypothetical protein [Paenibacillus harenae]MDQ0114195.1 hypothetical protein [Paenibacillus harenae]
MLNIKNKSIVMEMERDDLWQLGTALINGIIMETKIKWRLFYKGETETGFLRYVRLQHHVIFVYLEEIYMHLERMELLDNLDDELLSLYRQKPSC